jgi:NAD(P)-dependent dehydrogenase (short-subunit alcohol dehydrogenase family)
MSALSQHQGVAIVTGSAQGIGEAIALQLADDGYDLALNDIPANREALESVAEKARKKGRKAIVCVGDVSVEEDVKKLVASTIENFGGIDVVSIFSFFPYLFVVFVCCIDGRQRRNLPIGSIATELVFLNAETHSDIHVHMFRAATVDKFDKIFAVNVRGTYLCFRYAAEQMIKQGRGGRLVAASSVAGLTGEAFVSLYGATKWAIRGLVVSLGEAEVIFCVFCTGV